jgi:hypothetical protein
LLADGVKAAFSVKTSKKVQGDLRSNSGNIVRGSTDNPDLEVTLKNLDCFLEQARYDPSISSKMLHDWEQSLLQTMNVQSLKYQYAALYGDVSILLHSSSASSNNADIGIVGHRMACS